jgi:uncharacterized protein
MLRTTRSSPIIRAMVAATLALTFALLGTATAQVRFVSIGTASPAGAYYPLGIALADIWNRTVPGINFSAQETGGSVGNMNLLGSGEIELGMANENIGYDAYYGAEPFGRQIREFSIGWTLNSSQAVFVSLRSSGITDVGQLVARRVSLGAPGSSGNVIAQRILAANGVAEGTYTPVYLGWQESADAMADGAVDAAIMVGGQPFAAVESLALRQPVNILTFDDAELNAEGAYPLTTAPLPTDMYDTEYEGDTVVIRSIVYVSNDLDADLVHAMVAAVFDNIAALTEAHPTGGQAEVIGADLAAILRLPLRERARHPLT